jgi:hypothetical protein
MTLDARFQSSYRRSKWACFMILQAVAEIRWQLQWLEDLKQPINLILIFSALSSVRNASAFFAFPTWQVVGK